MPPRRSPPRRERSPAGSRASLPAGARGKGPAKRDSGPPAAAPGRSVPSWTWLVLAGALVLAFYGLLRIGVDEPWGYDDYYHLGVARELRHHFPLRAFPWTPFSVLAERFADKEPLFHLLLMPLAGLPLGVAALAGALLGQAFLIGSTAWFLWRQRVPRAAGWLLGLAGLGPFFVLRVEQVRPHVWMLGWSALLLAVLCEGASLWAVAAVSALFGLTHVAGWVGIAFALVWGLAGRLAAPGEERRIRLAPALAAAGGWLVGQLVHPNLPHNLWQLWTVNVVIPLAAAGAASRSLHEALGVELQPMALPLLLQQWPVFVAPALAVARLVRQPVSRSRAALTVTALSVAFLVGAAVLLGRLIEIGAVLGILALALVAGERARSGERVPSRVPGARALACLLVLAAAWTVVEVRDLGRGDLRPLGGARPLAMATYLGANGRPGAQVFTAQWADSAPLFYAAPQLKSLVALDPTFFYAEDPRLFERYWEIANGRSGDPVGEIARRFGARYLTLWKAPAFAPLGMQLRRDRRASIVYQDRFYEVWELAG